MVALLTCIIRPVATAARAVRPRPPADPALIAATTTRRATGLATAARRAALIACTAAPGAILALPDEVLPYPPPAPPGEPGHHAGAAAGPSLPFVLLGGSLFSEPLPGGGLRLAGQPGGPGGDGGPGGGGFEEGGTPSGVPEPALGAALLALGLFGALAWRRSRAG